MVAVYILLGIALGAGAAWLSMRARVDALRETAVRDRASAAENAALLEEARHNLQSNFAALSAQALQQNNTSFLELAQRELAPLKESLAKVDRQAQQLEHMRGSLTQQLTTVAAGQDRLRAETGNLVTALRAPHVRGRWGERQLRNVLEVAGMIEHCDFVVQSSERDADGHLLRPDVVVRLPGSKQVVIDAKAPLQSFLDAIEAPEGERERHLAAHARLLREHMRRLSAKAYWSQFDSAPDFVVMFLPGEHFHQAALEVAPDLIEEGVRQHVLIATPMTLITLLRAVGYGWQQERVADSARAIGQAGREPMKVDVGAMMGGNRSLSGVFLGAEIATDRVHDNIQQLIQDVADGNLKVLIDRTFSLRDAAEAHRYIESRQAVGRVLLIP